MGDNQSAFDPIFWLHHCNVERQFCSWQRAHAHKGGVSAPSDEDMKIVLYPFTKPDLLFSGKLSHTTPSSDENDGTFADWWPHETLPYKFDNYLTSQDAELEESEVMILSVYFSAEDFDSGDYNVYHVKSGKKTKIGSVSILTNQGGTCASCAKRTEVDISLFVEEDDFKDKDAVQEAIDKNEFIIIHDEAKIKVTRAEVKIVKSSLPELKRLIVQQDA